MIYSVIYNHTWTVSSKSKSIFEMVTQSCRGLLNLSLKHTWTFQYSLGKTQNAAPWYASYLRENIMIFANWTIKI